jgi:hypothetical protein
LLRRGFLSRSLLIGSGSSAPAVTTRRREENLPASAVSTPVSALGCVMRRTISASPLSPREGPPPTPQGTLSPDTVPHRWPKTLPPGAAPPRPRVHAPLPSPGSTWERKLARATRPVPDRSSHAHIYGAHNRRHRFQLG